jgi:hypothetical protein
MHRKSRAQNNRMEICESDRLAHHASLLDIFDDCTHRLVRDPQVARHGPEPLSLHPNRDLMPALGWNARPFGNRGIPANPRPPSRVE